MPKRAPPGAGNAPPNRSCWNQRSRRQAKAPLHRATEKPKPKPKPKKAGVPIFPLFAAQALGFALLAAGYFLGRGESTPSRASAKTADAANATGAATAPATIFRGVSERAFQVVDIALAAAKRGDAAGARDSLETAQREQVDVPGSDYRLALLAFQRHDLKEAKLRLDCAMAANQELAGCCYVLAMLAGAVGEYSQASLECARAAYSEPFNVRYLFFWAECLRRSGRMQEAITHFQEALNRPANPADLDYVAFKLRLAQIEAGRSGDFAEEMGKQMAAEKVPVYWLLTAAAMQLEAKDPATAATNLAKASKLIPAAEFGLLLRDYLFTSHSTEKEIAPFFVRPTAPALPSPNVAAITVDPLSWTLQSADPAAWSTAVQAR